jgi:hypothetical protein
MRIANEFETTIPNMWTGEVPGVYSNESLLSLKPSVPCCQSGCGPEVLNSKGALCSKKAKDRARSNLRSKAAYKAPNLPVGKPSRSNDYNRGYNAKPYLPAVKADTGCQDIELRQALLPFHKGWEPAPRM